MATQGLAVAGSSCLSSSFFGSSLRKSNAQRTSVSSLPVTIHAAAVTQRLKKVASKQPPAAVKGTQRVAAKPTGNGTITVGVKGSQFRAAEVAPKTAPKILRRVQELQLLSKLEKAGLLSQLEKSGITLSFIEKSGLLSTAESLGLLSAAADRNTPQALYAVTAVLFLLGPALVYFVPDDSTALIAAQAVGALAAIAGGAAAYGGATLLSSLQQESK